jgi:hypothetical protein
MKSIIVISLSLALITPALAAKRNYVRPVSYSAQPPSMGTMGPINAADYQAYVKALRESGYKRSDDGGGGEYLRGGNP